MGTLNTALPPRSEAARTVGRVPGEPFPPHLSWLRAYTDGIRK
jgi:hypothetical protein